MKRILAALCVLTSLHVHAQNNKLLSTGNVGIGTNTPNSQFLLHVANGDVLLQNTSGTGYPKLFSKSADGNTSLQLDFNSILVSGSNGIFRSTANLLLNDVGGNVGVGISTPLEKLHVLGNVQIGGADYFLRLHNRLTMQGTDLTTQNNATRGILSNNLRWNNLTNKWKMDNTTENDFAMIQFENNGGICFFTKPHNSSSAEINHVDLLNNYLRMYIDWRGQVGIGTLDTKGHKLAVGGSAIFTSAYVKLEPNWPDYVFEKDYQLLPLPELEKFIRQNKHLPEVPTAEEVAKDGLNLGTTQAALLKKIEELTLYIIEQNKKMEKQDKRIEEQDKQMKEMKAMILELKGVAKNTGN